MKNFKKSIIVLISLTFLMLLSTITLAATESTILKKSDNYFIYNDKITGADFTFAFSKNPGADKDELIFFTVAKDSASQDAKYVAYVDDTTRNYVNENGDTYLYVRDNNPNYVIEEEKINLAEAIDQDKIESTTKRISVDTTQSTTSTKTIDGVENEVTKGKVVITDSKDAKYSYILISVTSEENDYSKIYDLIEKITDKDAIAAMSFDEKIQLMKDFQEAYENVEPTEGDNTWLDVENMEILEPETSKNGDRYIVFIKKVDDEGITIDAQFLTCFDKYTPKYEKETLIIKETSKLPVTYDTTITLLVILAVIIVAIVIVLVVRKKASKKEDSNK